MMFEKFLVRDQIILMPLLQAACTTFQAGTHQCLQGKHV